MKVELHTSPVAEAFLSQDECPFCRLEKEAQQRAIRFFAGPSASYMEPGIRGLTNRLGFCSDHMKKLYDYGNVLGTALMLQSHMEDILLDLAERSKQPEKAEKTGFFQKKKRRKAEYSPAFTASCGKLRRLQSGRREYGSALQGLLFPAG